MSVRSVAVCVADNIAFAISFCHLLVLVDGEVFVDSCIEFAKRNRETEITLFEVDAVGVVKLKFAVLVRISVARPERECVRDERIFIGGDKHVVVFGEGSCLRVVVAVFDERGHTVRPSRAFTLFDTASAHTVLCVVVFDAEIERRADLESEVDIDAGLIAVEVDGDTAGVLIVGGVEFGQELSDTRKQRTVAIREHTDKVCDKSFV